MCPDRSRDTDATPADDSAVMPAAGQAKKDGKKRSESDLRKGKRSSGKKTGAESIMADSPDSGDAAAASEMKPKTAKSTAKKSADAKSATKKTASGKSAGGKKASDRKATAGKPATARKAKPSSSAKSKARVKKALQPLLATEAATHVTESAQEPLPPAQPPEPRVQAPRTAREYMPAGAPIYPSEAPPLEAPIHYGRSRVVLMARDSQGLYAYWDISAIDRGRHRIGQPHGPMLMLQVHDLGMGVSGMGDAGSQDISVALGQFDTHVFLSLPLEGHCWYCDFGILNQAGEFVPLAVSNTVKPPRQTLPVNPAAHAEVWMTREFERAASQSRPTPVQWAPAISENASAEIFRISGGYQALARVDGSRQLAPEARQPVAFPMGASEQLPIPGVPTGVPVGLPTSEAIGQPAGPERQRGFWLRVNTELIVYGQTEPDAHVSIQGLPVTLDRDGSFRIQFALPDGQQVIPVVAHSADGEQSRSVTPVVTRRTDDINL